MPGPPPKPADRRQGRHRTDLGLVGKPAASPPAPPKGLSAELRAEWAELWADQLSATFRPSHLPALRRLFEMRHRLATFDAAGMQEPLVQGSTGQLVMNPLLKEADVLRPQILALEDRFGLSPMAGLKLGAQYGDTARSLEELNRSLNADIDDEEDPRLTVIEASAREA